MSEKHADKPEAIGPPPPAPFRLAQFGIWLLLSAVLGLCVGWLAFNVQRHFAPLFIFPILVGLGLGVALAGLMRVTQSANRLTVIVGASIAVTVAVIGQHYFGYLDQRETTRRQAAEFRMAAEANPGLVRGTPPEPASGLVDFLRWQALRGRPILAGTVARGAWAWTTWAIDSMLTLVVVLLIVVPASRQPYCSRCRSWYRTVRRGRLPASLRSSLGLPSEIETPDAIREATFRLVGCQGGCGASGLEISWELASEGARTTRLWLSTEDRLRFEKACNDASGSPNSQL